MLFGLSQATSAMQSQNAALEVWSNDLANASTPGFSASEPEFGEGLPTAFPGLTPAGAGQGVASGTTLAAVAPEPSDGLTSTGRALDMAISGNGYFVLEQDGQRLLTRDGAFSVDATGTLVTASGADVLSSGMTPIRVPAGSTVTVRGGAIWADGQPVATLSVAQVTDPQGLTQVGNSDLAAGPLAGAVTYAPAVAAQVIGGYLNASGTSVADAMEGLVQVENAYALAAKAAGQAETLAGLTAQIPT